MGLQDLGLVRWVWVQRHGDGVLRIGQVGADRQHAEAMVRAIAVVAGTYHRITIVNLND